MPPAQLPGRACLFLWGAGPLLPLSQDGFPEGSMGQGSMGRERGFPHSGNEAGPSDGAARPVHGHAGRRWLPLASFPTQSHRGPVPDNSYCPAAGIWTAAPHSPVIFLFLLRQERTA